MMIRMFMIVIVLLLSACGGGDGDVRRRPPASCIDLFDTDTNASVSGMVMKCETPDGNLYIYEGIDMEFAP